MIGGAGNLEKNSDAGEILQRFVRRSREVIEAVEWDGRAETVKELMDAGVVCELRGKQLLVKNEASGAFLDVLPGWWVRVDLESDVYPIEPARMAEHFVALTPEEEAALENEATLLEGLRGAG